MSAKRLPKAIASIVYWIVECSLRSPSPMPMYADSKSPISASSSAVPWNSIRPPLRST